MTDALLKALRKTHAEYERDLEWHRFLLDAYAGTGGFAGRVRQPFASFWGRAADVYADAVATVTVTAEASEQHIETYLDRFPREDVRKFRARADAAIYYNFIEPVVDLRLSYLRRQQFTREAEPEVVTDWRSDAGDGQPWDAMLFGQLALRSSLLGWTLVQFDRPTPEGVEPGAQLSRAQAELLGVRTYAIPRMPGELLDFDMGDDGRLERAKLVSYKPTRASILDQPRVEARFELWDRGELRVVTARSKAGAGGLAMRAMHDLEVVDDVTMANPYGLVPLVVMRHKAPADDGLRGLSMITSLAQAARDYHNVRSEYREHLRSCAFGMLQKVVPKRAESGSTQTVGAGNVLPIPPDSSRDHKWISPDPSVATTYREELAEIRRNIMRIARSEQVEAGNEGGQRAQSGVARAWGFEGLNRALADQAKEAALFDERALELVAQLEGVSAEEAREIRTTPPSKFDVEELTRELEEAILAIDGLGLGPTARFHLRERMVDKILPNLPEEQREAVAAEHAAAMRDEVLAAAATPTPDGTVERAPREADDDEAEVAE
jgi:hypothetical protein